MERSGKKRKIPHISLDLFICNLRLLYILQKDVDSPERASKRDEPFRGGEIKNLIIQQIPNSLETAPLIRKVKGLENVRERRIEARNPADWGLKVQETFLL